MQTLPLPRLCLLVTFVAAAGLQFVRAQQARTASPPVPTEEKLIELSPFEVRTEKDTGYSAQNTTSGSRLNTSLADTPAAISVFTKEFIEDIGATKVEDLVEYSINSRSNFLEGANLNSDSPQGQGNALTNNDAILSVRGIAGASRFSNAFQSSVSQDTFNLERAELTRGPNSVLAGVGQPGGGFNVGTKKADVNRQTVTASFRFGSWDETRATLDINQPVVTKKLALRINTASTDANGWRPFTYNQEQRHQFNVRWQPAKNTRVDVEYELGRREYAVAPQTGLVDQITPWIAAGRQRDTVVGQPTGAAGTAAAAALTAGGMQLLTNQNSLVYDTTTGVIYNARNQSVSAPVGTGDNAKHLFDFNLAPREIFTGGPGYGTSNDYDRYHATLSHELVRDLFVEAAFNREVVDNLARNTIEGAGNVILVDPNAFLPSGAPNPHAGEFYTEGQVIQRRRKTNNDDYRLSASYDLEPARRWRWAERWIGRQRVAGMFQSRQAGSIENQQEEVLIQNPFATTSPDEGNGNLNRLRRRTYLGTSLTSPTGQIGLHDYRAFPVNGLNAVTSSGAPIVTLPISTTFVPFGQTRDTFRRTNSTLYVWQGNLLFDRLVATVGYREDRVRTILPDTTLRAAPFPPFTQGVLIPGRSNQTTSGGGITRTQGLVAKPLSWVSLFYNRSSSFDVPAQTVVIFNNVPPPSSRGLTGDYGAKFSLLNGKVFATVTRYETSANDQTGNTGVQNFVTNANLIWDTLEFAGVPEAIGTTVFANGRTFDRISTGWEFEVTANLTANWRLILNYSANKTLQSNHAKEIIDYYDQFTPLYTAGTRGRLIIGGTPGQLAANAIDATDAVTTIAERLQEVRADFQDQFISPDGVRQLGQPVDQGNVRTTYAFREGVLRGVSVGGGARWRGERVIGYTSTDPAVRREIRGDPTVTVDFNASYRRKVGLLGRKCDLTIQLNVNNTLNDDDLIITRTFADGTPRTFSSPAPIQWFVTTTVRF
ncbi:MAG: hypothetical protein Q8N18_00030 [Opitutaceae bacterium]|nr:hypothetical protein [Opitutaceae bacterium]